MSIECNGCGCTGPTVCECDGDKLYEAKSRIINLEYALREAMSLATYYCPEELERSLSAELRPLRETLNGEEE